MWFRYPSGWNNINVNQQEFFVDYKDSDGNEYFVAPESLAPQILVVPGFVVVARPAGAPADIKDNTPAEVADPMAQLSAQVETMRLENDALKKGVSDLTKERDEVKAELEAAKATMDREFAKTTAPSPTTPAPTTAPPAPAAPHPPSHPAGTRK